MGDVVGGPSGLDGPAGTARLDGTAGAGRLAATGLAKPPAAVLWDLGGVFLDWDPRYLYRKLFAGDEVAMESFLANVCTPAWHFEQDLGRSVVEACSTLAASRPEYAELVLAWGERSEEMIGGVIPGSVALLGELRAAGVRQYALSNMEPENWEKRRRYYEFLSWFDGWFISGLEGVGKPDPQFFKSALERFGLAPGEAFFVDDKEANVLAAAALGIRGTVFRRAGGPAGVAGAQGSERAAGTEAAEGVAATEGTEGADASEVLRAQLVALGLPVAREAPVS